MSMYLDVVGIAGESQSPVANWNAKIDQQSMGYDVSQATSLEAGSGLTVKGAEFSQMQITKAMDVSTPKLGVTVSTGEPTATVTSRINRPGADPLGPAGGSFEAENYIMQNVIAM